MLLYVTRKMHSKHNFTIIRNVVFFLMLIRDNCAVIFRYAPTSLIRICVKKTQSDQTYNQVCGILRPKPLTPGGILNTYTLGIAYQRA